MTKAKLEAIYNDVIWYGRKRVLGLPLSFTLYVLTDSKLYTRTGFLNLKEERVDLYRVVDFSLELPLGQRIFGCGTLKIFSKDKSQPDQKMVSIKSPREVLRLLEENVERERQKYRVQGRDMIGASGFDSIGSSDMDD